MILIFLNFHFCRYLDLKPFQCAFTPLLLTVPSVINLYKKSLANVKLNQVGMIRLLSPNALFS